MTQKVDNSDTLSITGPRFAVLTLLLLLLSVLGLPAAAQAQSTWNGGGADGNWLTSANWSSVPAANSALTFDGSTQLTNTNNFAAGTAFGLITFASTAGNFFLTGNRITLSNNIVTAGTATQTMAMDLTLNGNRNITNNNTSTLVLSGVINESGGARNLQKVGTGTLVLSNTANTFTGQMQINQGTVQVTKLANTNQSSSIGAGTNVVRVGQTGTTGTLEYTGTGDTTDRQINIGNGDGGGGSTILNNGSGALVFNNATFNVSGAAGSATNARSLTLGGTNTGANTISGAVANTGSGSNLKTISVIKQDAGTWVLSASNAYTGGTILSNGVLRAGNNDAFGTGAFTLSGGTLASDGATARTFTNAVVLTANATLTETNVGTGDLTLSGPVTTTGAANRTLTVNRLATFSGLVDGSSGALFKAGVGTLVLANTANTFSGGFGINQGTVQVTKLADVGANSSVGTRNSNSVMRLGQQGTTGTLEYTGTGDTTDLQINIGNADGVGGSTILNNGSGALVFDNATFNVSGTAGSATNARSLTLGGANAGANTISGVIADTGSGSNLKTISVVKTNAGTWILSGANTYTGTTTVNAGVLELAATVGGAAADTASVSVATNAILLLSQTSQVNNDAAVTLSGGTITRGSGVSEVFGNLQVTGASYLDFGSGTAGHLTFGTYTQSALLTVQNFYQGNSLVFSQNLVSAGLIDSSSSGSYNNGIFAFADGFTTSWNGTDTFTITAIPEPSTYLAAAGLLAVVMWPSRRRLIKDVRAVLGLRAPMRDRLTRRPKNMALKA
jgi:fibronectin-binding autotransporter adhesin